MPRMTVDDVIAAYRPVIESLAANKPRDPGERELLVALRDPVIARENPALVRNAGALARPGPSAHFP